MAYLEMSPKACLMLTQFFPPLYLKKNLDVIPYLYCQFNTGNNFHQFYMFSIQLVPTSSASQRSCMLFNIQSLVVSFSVAFYVETFLD